MTGCRERAETIPMPTLRFGWRMATAVAIVQADCSYGFSAIQKWSSAARSAPAAQASNAWADMAPVTWTDNSMLTILNARLVLGRATMVAEGQGLAAWRSCEAV